MDGAGTEDIPRDKGGLNGGRLHKKLRDNYSLQRNAGSPDAGIEPGARTRQIKFPPQHQVLRKDVSRDYLPQVSRHTPCLQQVFCRPSEVRNHVHRPPRVSGIIGYQSLRRSQGESLYKLARYSIWHWKWFLVKYGAWVIMVSEELVTNGQP
jgi:hypothetical protein